MPTAISHPAAALALRLGTGRKVVSNRLLALGVACSVLPDSDVVGFWLGVPYGHLLGHRGFSHSLFFALLLGWIASRYAERLHATSATAFVVVGAVTASHGLLDALTSGGLGVAFLSPFSNERFFFPWRPIIVSPISVVRFFESRSLAVLGSELLWVWLPMLALGGLGVVLRRGRESLSEDRTGGGAD